MEQGVMDNLRQTCATTCAKIFKGGGIRCLIAVFPFHGPSLACPMLIPGVSHSKTATKPTFDEQRELLGRTGYLFSWLEKSV